MPGHQKLLEVRHPPILMAGGSTFHATRNPQQTFRCPLLRCPLDTFILSGHCFLMSVFPDKNLNDRCSCDPKGMN